MKHNLLIVSHLGAGDHIITSGIVREKAKEYDLVVVPCKYHNTESINYLYRDLPNVAVRAVIDHDEQVFFAKDVWKHEVLWLGCDNQPFNAQKFDTEFYRQANLSFQLRWDNFKVARDPKVEVAESGYQTFVHEDVERGMKITPLPEPFFNIYRPSLWTSRNIFAYLSVLEQVRSIHCINSSFALLVDSIDLPQNPHLYLHLYARPGGEVPTFRKPWIRLQQPLS